MQSAIRPVQAQDAENSAASLLHEQTELARQQGVQANTPAKGDAKFKSMFYGRLPAQLQRALFLDYVANPAHWPRVRSLFGAPPYGFLNSTDCHTLRAGGFAAQRVNMAKPSLVGTASQFGSTTMSDLRGRRFKLLLSPDGELAAVSSRRDGLADLAVLLPKRKRGEMPVGLPRPGETLDLTDARVQGAGAAYTARVVRSRSRSPDAFSRTGLVTVRVLA